MYAQAQSCECRYAQARTECSHAVFSVSSRSVLRLARACLCFGRALLPGMRVLHACGSFRSARRVQHPWALWVACVLHVVLPLLISCVLHVCCTHGLVCIRKQYVCGFSFAATYCGLSVSTVGYRSILWATGLHLWATCLLCGLSVFTCELPVSTVGYRSPIRR